MIFLSIASLLLALPSSWALPQWDALCDIGDAPNCPSTTSTPRATTKPSKPIPNISQPVPQPIKPKIKLTPIKTGYVAFGDSYAAGIGTGKTTTDGCRQGEFSHPKQIAALAGKNIYTGENIDFQNYACSGDVLSDVRNRQIKAWKDPQKADIATISIGGNDLGFADILIACILRVYKSLSGNCQREMDKARAKMKDKNFHDGIGDALKEIIQKSGRQEFKVILTGYPAFFNEKTSYCDKVTFDWWGPTHHIIKRPWLHYLDSSLRSSLNTLSHDWNDYLEDVVKSVNDKRAIFVNPDPAFEGHRFCEDGVNEPDWNRMDTWFFLSAWPDNHLTSDSPLKSDSDKYKYGDPKSDPELIQLAAGNTTAFPTEAEACKDVGNDLGKKMLCAMTQEVADTTKPAGISDEPNPMTPHDYYNQDMQLLKDKKYTELKIPFYVLTRSAKTFHPRSLGHQAYLQEIIKKW